jgi:hypothetical protein
VLKHSTIDALRKSPPRSRSLDVEQAVESIPDSSCQAALETAIQRSQPLPAADVVKMGDWPARDRVVLGCLCGVWRKVPPAHWQRWVDEFRQEYGAPTPGGFPPDDFEGNDDVNERTATLADLLGQRLNTLRVWIHRGKRRLWQLAYVRERIEPREDDL